jgi:acetoin:2,6-dichlorophenolindophenol oxidoreductase subunit alpha
MDESIVKTDDLIVMYRKMARIREFESQMLPLHEKGLIRGSAHPCLGMEAVPVGICHALAPNDLVTSTHRGHGHSIAKGLDMGRMMAELFGRVDGYCRGRGGSMHITSIADGMLGADGIVAGSVAIAVGAAVASRLQGKETVVASFFGDGGINEGLLHEALNLASILAAPVVFVCENNQWAMTTRIQDVTNVEPLSLRAAAYGIAGVTVDGNDVAKVFEASQNAVTRARSGDGPTLIEAVTYRVEGHSANAPISKAPEEEIEKWRERDPLKVTRSQLVAEQGEFIVAELDGMAKEARIEVEHAIEFATASLQPDVAELFVDVYSPSLGSSHT